QSGGSYITIFGASGYSLADHPLNPSPGVDQRFAIKVPFEIWNIDANQQVNALFWDRSGNPTVNGGAAWNTTNREYMWIVNTPYSTDPIDEASQTVADNATWNLVLYKSTFTTGDIFRFNYDNPIQIGTDTYNYKTTAATFSTELAKDQVDEINVFPNPYYGVNSEELNKYNRFVTFTHLPEQATIRIFNLAGVHVRTIQKDDSGQFQRWDLANENGLPVASGLYIAYIDMPVVGTTKILKLAIIQEQQILDRF
ncbi:MAG: T9SS type A sorting domain-containing protein, partial [Ignavibacteriaceae bacterium]|nr:T9SS type A sorting domain-containing protein [Ignavibacteriaceae bacterium]